MKAKAIVFPNDDGFNVLIWEAGSEGSLRVRHFENRQAMTAVLESLRVIGAEEARELEQFSFLDSCPLYSCEVEEEVLSAHEFHIALK